jgi:hypothetical protein
MVDAKGVPNDGTLVLADPNDLDVLPVPEGRLFAKQLDCYGIAEHPDVLQTVLNQAHQPYVHEGREYHHK